MTANELISKVKEIFNNCADFSVRECKSKSGSSFVILFIAILCDKKYVTDSVLRPIIASDSELTRASIPGLLATLPIKEGFDADFVTERLLAGNAVIIGEEESGFYCFSAEAKTEDSRGISEPDTEVTVRGPRQGFVESAEVNVMLIRKIIRNPSLKVVEKSFGDLTRTSVRIMYIDKVARKEIVDSVIEKISSINIPSCIDSGYLEQFLQSSKHNLISEVGNSEKPDKVAAKLLGGRIAIVCDGSPVVLTVPYLFTESIQSSEDYLKSLYYSTFSRILRFTGLILTIFLPAIYVAILSFHKGALPYSLYKAQMLSRQDIPFDVFTEMLIILIIFELIREVGIRMPKAVGSAVSIVGALVLGDAAIKAGIASETVIMISALTVICNFMNPTYMNTNVIIRFLFLVLSKIFGFYGIAAGLMISLSILCKKKSFGVPYLSPFAPINENILYDTLISVPKKAIINEQGEILPFEKK